MAESDIGQSDGTGHFGRYFYFLSDTVYQMKVSFGKEDSQRNARKTTACTEVHNVCAGSEVYHFGNAQRMEYVVFVKVGNVFTWNHVDFAVPIGI